MIAFMTLEHAGALNVFCLCDMALQLPYCAAIRMTLVAEDGLGRFRSIETPSSTPSDTKRLLKSFPPTTLLPHLQSTTLPRVRAIRPTWGLD